jgi:hypothetical protein
LTATSNTPIDSALSEQDLAMTRFIAAARAVPSSAANTPIHQASWTPAQIVEHVAITTEVAANGVRGGGFGKIPLIMPLLRPLLRNWYGGVLKRGAFPKQSKGPPVLKPSESPPPIDASITRLERALRAADPIMREFANKGDGTFKHAVFGRISVAEYVRFGAIHAVHHAEQLEQLSAG